MTLYTTSHKYYCGIDLHTKVMYVSIMDHNGTELLHKNMPSTAEHLTRAIAPFREDIVIGCECIFTWYWLSDFCSSHNIPFVLGHALAMSAIHKSKHKNDSADSRTICNLLRTKYLPIGYDYPQRMRATRDLMRRRMEIMHMRSDILSHTQTLSYIYHGERLKKKLRVQSYRESLDNHFSDPIAQLSLDVDRLLIAQYDKTLALLEDEITRQANDHDPQSIKLLRSIPGIGKILSLVILYEMNTVHRFPTVQKFISYSRLITPRHESDGKKIGNGNKKIGNRYLRWAFGELAVLTLRFNEQARHAHKRLVEKKGKQKALSMLAAHLGRTVYFILKTETPFSQERFMKTP